MAFLLLDRRSSCFWLLLLLPATDRYQEVPRYPPPPSERLALVRALVASEQQGGGVCQVVECALLGRGKGDLLCTPDNQAGRALERVDGLGGVGAGTEANRGSSPEAALSLPACLPVSLCVCARRVGSATLSGPAWVGWPTGGRRT